MYICDPSNSAWVTQGDHVSKSKSKMNDRAQKQSFRQAAACVRPGVNIQYHIHKVKIMPTWA